MRRIKHFSASGLVLFLLKVIVPTKATEFDHFNQRSFLKCATAQLRSIVRQSAQCYFILAHFQHFKFNTVYIHIA